VGVWSRDPICKFLVHRNLFNYRKSHILYKNTLFTHLSTVHIKLGRYGRGRDVGRVTDGDLVEHNAGEMTGHAVCYRSEIIVA